jgi:hypothetical protein
MASEGKAEMDLSEQESRTAPVRSDLSSIAESAGPKLESLAEPLKEKARRLVERQKDLAVDQIGNVAHAAHHAARELETQMPQAASLIHDAATRLEDVASALQERSIDENVETIGKLARTRPLAFFGGAVLAGFALSRFLKSSADHLQSRRHI